jgi:hypothetical protein
MISLRITSVSALALATAGVLVCGDVAAQGLDADAPAVPTPSIPRVADYVAQTVSLPAVVGEPFQVAVQLDDAAHVLDLRPHSLRADGFRVLVQGDDGVLRDVAPPPVSTYRGVVVGREGSAVTAGINDGRLTAYIELGGGAPAYVLQPADRLDAAADRDMHVSFVRGDAAPADYHCGADLLDQPLAPAGRDVAGGSALAGSGLETIELGVDADYHYFLEEGGTVAGTVSEVENVLHTVEFVYERDVSITYEITVIVVRTSSATNPYTSSNPETLLCQFRDEWNSPPESSIPRDTAQLFTGRPLGSFSGGTIGLAWRATICNLTGTSACGGGLQNLSYSAIESNAPGLNFDERVSLSAHELGHSWNAIHCSGSTCHIMCAAVGFCGGTVGSNLKFGPVSISAISAFRNTRPCLVEHPNPLTPPFFDDFPSALLDTEKWTWRLTSGSGVATLGINEPSPPNSILIYSAGDALYRDGEIRSNHIELAGGSGMVASFWVQSNGVEIGEQLFVEYYSLLDEWASLVTVDSPGVDLDFYIPFEIPLPANAYHDRFRIRFRVEGDEVNDRWFIDDIHVGEPLPDPCPADFDGNGMVDFQDLLSLLAEWGPCVDCPEDIDGNGLVDFQDLLEVLATWGDC